MRTSTNRRVILAMRFTPLLPTPESVQHPAALAESTREVKRGETLRIRMENGGGFAAALQPKN